MKVCTDCLTPKLDQNFYPKKKKCKTCYIAQVRKYQRTPSGKASVHKATAKRNSTEKARVRSITNRAISSGELVRLPCEVKGCEVKRTHAHHDDYNKPLEVRWLCRKHHWEWHAHNKAIEIKESN